MNFPEDKIKTHQATGLLTILKGDATEERVDRELKNLVKENWDFKVKQTHLQEYWSSSQTRALWTLSSSCLNFRCHCLA